MEATKQPTAGIGSGSVRPPPGPVIPDPAGYVRYELWDPGPGPLPAWDRLWEGRFHLGTGPIGIAQHFAEEWDEYVEFDTGERDSAWSARVLNRVLSNTEEPDFPADIVEVDLYRVQLWPLVTA
ncbi:hypothetical protein ACWCSD_04815 [Nonomuraea sp. NPDC001684]